MISAVKSVIKMVNRRVKGSEKSWSEPGAGVMLQLRADYLSETKAMSRFWITREDQARSSRLYRVQRERPSTHTCRASVS